MVECLLSMCKALGFIPTAKEEKIIIRKTYSRYKKTKYIIKNAHLKY
jgi:hypothetical protein